MITATVTESDVRFEFVLDEGEVAFVDADWLPALGRGSVAAVTVGPDHVRWADQPLGATGDGREPIGLARSLLVATAREVVGRVGTGKPWEVHVPGRGATAAEIRRRLGLALAEAPSQPRIWVETTGDASALVTALGGVMDLGTVVLAAPARQPTIAIDLYRDVHLRGLHL
jgi:hypothetical protein